MALSAMQIEYRMNGFKKKNSGIVTIYGVMDIDQVGSGNGVLPLSKNHYLN